MFVCHQKEHNQATMQNVTQIRYASGRGKFPFWIQIEFWNWILRILAHKAEHKLLFCLTDLILKIVQEVVSLHSIITASLEIRLYPRVWVHTIKTVHI